MAQHLLAHQAVLRRTLSWWGFLNNTRYDRGRARAAHVGHVVACAETREGKREQARAEFLHIQAALGKYQERQKHCQLDHTPSCVLVAIDGVSQSRHSISLSLSVCEGGLRTHSVDRVGVTNFRVVGRTFTPPRVAQPARKLPPSTTVESNVLRWLVHCRPSLCLDLVRAFQPNYYSYPRIAARLQSTASRSNVPDARGSPRHVPALYRVYLRRVATEQGPNTCVMSRHARTKVPPVCEQPTSKHSSAAHFSKRRTRMGVVQRR